MSKGQYGIKCPRSGKTLTVSRDVYHALQETQKQVAKQQEDLTAQLKQTGQALSNKYYIGETSDLGIAVKFNDRGRIDDAAAPQIELKNELDKLPPETKLAVEKAIEQFMDCINQALEVKTTDMEKELKDRIQPAA